MNKKKLIGIIVISIMILSVVGCSSSNDNSEKNTLSIADYYGEYVFDEVVFMRKTDAISDEQYEDDLKQVTKMFTDAEFSIKESYFNDTSGVFGTEPSENFEWLTVSEYGEKYYDDQVKERLENFQGLGSIFDYDKIKEDLNVDEIKHYTMYEEGGILSNPMLYISDEDIFIAMETITAEELDGTLEGITHYMLRLKEK